VTVLVAFCGECILPTAVFAQGPSNSSATQTGDALLPMQKAETTATPPFYKRWWF
jgi:hypothetical protein